MKKIYPKLKPNIQLFADPVPDEPNAQNGTEPNSNVSDNNELERLKSDNKLYQSTLKSIFGISENDELGDINQQMIKYNSNISARAAAVNDKIITAEIKSLQGYDTKLLAKVLDRSEIKVFDDGTVTGLTEAVKAAAKEYPAVVLKQDSKPYAPYNPAPVPQPAMTAEEFAKLSYEKQYEFKQKNPDDYKKIIGGK